MAKRMRRVATLAVMGLVASWMVGGCTSVLPTVQIPVSLGSSSAFEATAGEPLTKTFTANFDTAGITVGSGSVEVPLSAISIEPNAAAKALQEVTCGDACDVAGVDSSTCESVCNAGNVSVTARVGLVGDIDTVCTTGDMYGPFLVMLDGENNPISVSPSSAAFQPKTLQALNAGSASFCVEVIAPISGTVNVGELGLNAGL